MKLNSSRYHLHFLLLVANCAGAGWAVGGSMKLGLLLQIKFSTCGFTDHRGTPCGHYSHGCPLYTLPPKWRFERKHAHCHFNVMGLLVIGHYNNVELFGLSLLQDSLPWSFLLLWVLGSLQRTTSSAGFWRHFQATLSFPFILGFCRFLTFV